jgi:phosphatidylglycerophosphate synthase
LSRGSVPSTVPAEIAEQAQAARPRLRPPELEDSLNRFVYHPLAARLARLLARTPITPNAVSVAGALMVWVAAFAYTQLAWPVGVALGLFFHCLWHVLDGADGDLARLTGKASPFGEMVDGACDYAAHSLLYVALAAVLDDQLGIWAWLFGLAAAASHSLQTNHAETQRRSYLWWAYGVPWLKHTKAADQAGIAERGWLGGAFGWLAGRYLAVANRMAPWATVIDGAVQAARSDPRRVERIRRLVRRSWRGALKLEKVVGANPRTIILGVSMALGSPIWFFLAETVLLNLILLISIWYHNRLGRQLAEAVAEVAAGGR